MIDRFNCTNRRENMHRVRYDANTRCHVKTKSELVAVEKAHEKDH